MPASNADLCGLFDLDGSLLDSEGHKDDAHRNAVRRFGGTLPDDFVRPVGASFETSCLTAINAAGLDIPFPDYEAVYRTLYAESKRDLQLMPGAAALLHAMKRYGARQAIVTASSHIDMHDALNHTGIWPHFCVTVSADQVTNTKPDPEPYLLAMDKLRAKPMNCFALEDTETGVASAHAAGVRVCAVRHKHNHGHDFSRAFAVLDSLEETNYVVQMLLAAAGRL